jgi:hypothetical protein
MVVPTSSMAKDIEVHEDDYAIIWEMNGGFESISYTIEVTEGTSIDVYFLDNENSANYILNVHSGTDYPISYIASVTELDTRHASHRISLDDILAEDGKTMDDIGFNEYSIIIDNTDLGTKPPENLLDDVVYVTYTVEVEYGEQEGTPFDFLSSGLAGVCVIAFWGVVALLILIVVVKIKKRKSSQLPPAPPYQQTQAFPQTTVLQTEQIPVVEARPMDDIKTKMDKLREVKDAGLLTDEEYEEKRRKILDEI